MFCGEAPSDIVRYPAGAAGRSHQAHGFRIDERWGGLVRFIEAEADSKQKNYVQQQIPFRVRLYNDGSLIGGELAEPQVENAVIERLGDEVRYSTTRNGRRYARAAGAEEIVGVSAITGDETILAASQKARAMVCPAAEVNFLSGPGKGVLLIKLGKDDRLLVIIGPCSVHDPDAATE